MTTEFENADLAQVTIIAPAPENSDAKIQSVAMSDAEATVAEAVRAILRIETVDMTASFFELGGHSVHAARLLTRLRRDLAPSLRIRTIFEARSLSELASLIDGMSAESGGACVDPLSFQQERIWSHLRMFPNSAHYNLGEAFHIRGAVDAGALSRALDRIVLRHDVLRSRFSDDEGAPNVAYADTAFGGLNVEDIDEDVSDIELAKGLAVLRDMPMALEKGEVFRARLLRRSADDAVFFFAPHHIIWDGMSWDVFLRELAAFYEDETGGAIAAARRSDRRYADFAQAQKNWVASRESGSEFDYWRDQFAGEVPALALPADVKRPQLFDYAGGAVSFCLSAETGEKVRAFSARHQCTPFVVYLALWRSFLHRITGQSDFVIGAPTAGRLDDNDSALIGCLGGMLGLRGHFDGKKSLDDAIAAAREKFLDTVENQQTPIEVLIEQLVDTRDTSRTPLFQAMLTHQNISDRPEMLGSVTLAPFDLPVTTAPTDIHLDVKETRAETIIALNYASAVFSEDGARYFASCFQEFLNDGIQRSEKPISDIAIMAQAERRRLVETMNETYTPYRKDALAFDYFDERAADNGGAPAVSLGDDTLTYAALGARANRIAHLLRSEGVREGDTVAVYQDRTIDMIASILGVWKAGGVLLPVDPGFPQARLAYMLKDAGARTVITTGAFIDNWLTAIAPVIDIASEETKLNAFPASAPQIDRSKTSSRAYVIYTSGSTGDPKGVDNSHPALCNFIESMMREPGMSANDRLLAVTTISFDVMLLELFVTLSAGAEIVLASDEDAMDGFALSDLIERRDITVLQGTPSTWRILFDAEWSGKADLKALCGGEAMPADIADRLPKLVNELWNMYGPTETTVWSTCARIESAANIHVGRPIQNTQIYILDDNGAPTPAGVAGDLWIGGEGVARGYLGKPALTDERFKDNPFDASAGRIYNTGDRACWRRDGVIEIFGRRDEQVKVRGYRIELGDIEAALSKHPAIGKAAAALRDDLSGEASIVAYYVPAPGASATSSELRRFLRDRLPHYMTPQFFIELAAFPLTNNNKIDRKALPAPAGAAPTRRAAPSTPHEIALAEIWRDILSAPDISVTDNFFELGGQSLQAARMIARARDAIGLSLTPREVIFESLEQLAAGAAAA